MASSTTPQAATRSYRRRRIIDNAFNVFVIVASITGIVLTFGPWR